MHENNAKGWHGSYSVVGRISAEKYHVILMKNKILEEKERKKKVNSFLIPSDSFESKKKLKPGEDEIDIFEETPKKKVETEINEEKEETKNNNNKISCGNIHKINSEAYKAHYLHHQEIEKQIKKMNKHPNLYVNSMKYNPKMDYIWKRVISGPKWNTISGRERIKKPTKILKPKTVDINLKIVKNNEIKKDEKNLNKNKKNKKNKNEKNITNTLNTIIMNKQTARGDLPTYYDHRIRNVKAFIVKNLKKTNTSKNINTTNNINENSSKKPKNIKNTLRISLSTDNNSNFLARSKSTKIQISTKLKNKTNYNNINSPINNNNNLLLKPSLSQDMKGINFSKTISRDQLNFIHRDREGLRPYFMPNYEFVEPRCVSMVSYSKRTKQKSNINRLKGVDPYLYFDPNKVINKYNNHIETNAPNFKLMVGRAMNSGPLPSYMINKFDRNSLESITEKGLRMNGYLNSKFNKKFSTFYPKKSFNRLVNNNYLKDEKFSEKCLNYLTKECFYDKKLRKSIEYYNKDVNYYLEQNSIKRNFDGVTFSTYKDNIKKFKDKEYYEKCFNDRYNGFC